MRYRNKNDINYFKFLELSSNIVDETDSRHVLEEAYKVFKPRNLKRFSRALEVNGKLKRRFVLDLDFDQEGGAGRFIDVDTNYGDGDLKAVLNLLLTPRKRFFFWRYDLERDLSLREGESVLEDWRNYITDIKTVYEYIYNPPIRFSEGSEMTQGTHERQAFADMYGGYMEITYLLTNGHAKDEELVWSWGINRFLFRGEYSLRKRDVENIK
mgnify:CR=1 FL=1|tara:strand:+ start:461 stop:1096 length:636 start_codon:yes stop_codon:yes gene_type:complete